MFKDRLVSVPYGLITSRFDIIVPVLGGSEEIPPGLARLPSRSGTLARSTFIAMRI